MRAVGLGIAFTVGVTFIAPRWLATTWAALAPAAVAEQRQLPELLYTCPMHPEVLEGTAGTCPVCKMRLEPVRIEEERWYACPIHAATLGPNPGVCPLDKREKMPVVVTVHWICSESADQKLMEPGTCADGTARKEIHQIRAHGDHNPRHGGQFYMAADSWHHVEGTYPQPGLFRLYFYDNFTQPIDPKAFTARIVGDGRPDTPLKAGRSNTMEAAIANGNLPLKLTLKVKFASDSAESQFDFTFSELSKDPAPSPARTSTASRSRAPASSKTAGAGSPSAGTSSSGRSAAAPPAGLTAPSTPNTLPAPAAPPASVAAVPAPPPLANCSPNISRTDVLLISDSLPGDTSSLLDLLGMCRTEVQKLIESGQFGFVYQPTMLGKEIALALEAHINTLPERRQAAATDSIRRVVLSAWQLDLYGDMGDQTKLTDAYKLFAAAVDEIGSAYAATR